jgi:UDP-N-acetylmuramate--alanine ligase
LLNVDKDHQELDELRDIFTHFRDHSKKLFITNRSNPIAANLSTGADHDFAFNENDKAGYKPSGFHQEGMQIHFNLLGTNFSMNTLGAHNMENATAAIAIAHQLGVSANTSARALSQYEGIYRRHQYLGTKHGVSVIDDYAHNPVKCAASIRACQPIAPKVVAWFQPHGYGPTRFLRNDFVKEIANALRPQDQIWMSEIYYAGGSAVKDISAADLIEDIRKSGKQAFFVKERDDLYKEVSSHLSEPCVLLLMGARDPALEHFGKKIFEQI